MKIFDLNYVDFAAVNVFFNAFLSYTYLSLQFAIYFSQKLKFSDLITAVVFDGFWFTATIDIASFLIEFSVFICIDEVDKLRLERDSEI